MKKILIMIVLTLLLLLTACTETTSGKTATDEVPPVSEKKIEEKVEPVVNWKDISLNDVNTGKNFKISDFKGKPILIESFAVWCPICTKQQREVKKLHETNKEVVSISLDTDPNEDEAFVKEHAQNNGFDWHYVVSPVSLTKALIDEFGSGVVNAPSAPVIIICPDDSNKYLKRGVKDAAELQKEIDLC